MIYFLESGILADLSMSYDDPGDSSGGGHRRVGRSDSSITTESADSITLSPSSPLTSSKSCSPVYPGNNPTSPVSLYVNNKLIPLGTSTPSHKNMPMTEVYIFHPIWFNCYLCLVIKKKLFRYWNRCSSWAFLDDSPLIAIDRFVHKTWTNRCVYYSADTTHGNVMIRRQRHSVFYIILMMICMASLLNTLSQLCYIIIIIYNPETSKWFK